LWLWLWLWLGFTSYGAYRIVSLLFDSREAVSPTIRVRVSVIVRVRVRVRVKAI